MEASEQSAAAVLQARIRSKEEDVIRLKRTVNEIFTDAGESPPYPNVGSADMQVDLSAMRTDLFYGQTLSGAAKMYLEMRKSAGLGSASVNDIYAALKKGGFPFETKNDDYAKNGLRISLRKNSGVFHRLPRSGDYGLLAWYEKFKGRSGNGDDELKNKKKAKKSTASKNKKSANTRQGKKDEDEIPF